MRRLFMFNLTTYKNRFIHVIGVSVVSGEGEHPFRLRLEGQWEQTLDKLSFEAT